MLYLLIGYMWLFIHRPFEIWPVLGEVRIELVYLLVMLAVWAFYADKRWLPNRLHVAFFAFAAAVVLCWLVSPWKSDYSDQLVENYLKSLMFYLLLVTVIREEKDLKIFIRAFLIIMFVYMLHSLKEYYFNDRFVYRMGFFRMIGVDVTMGDPNTFAGSVLNALPFVALFNTGLGAERPKWQRKLNAAFPFVFLAVAILCMLLTGSRSALLGLLLFVGITIAKSRRRWQFAGLFLVAAPCIWLLLPTPLQIRFETIVAPELGPASAQVSATGRLKGLETGLELWAQYPVVGCGPGAWRLATNSFLESHNLYGQILGEMGTLGAVTFLAVLLAFWTNLRRVKAAHLTLGSADSDFPYAVSRAIGFSLLIMLFEGNFGHNLFRFNWLWYGAFLVVARHIMERRLAEGPLPSEPLVTAPDGCEAFCEIGPSR